MPNHFVKKLKSHQVHLCKAETKYQIVKNITSIQKELIKMEDI